MNFPLFLYLRKFTRVARNLMPLIPFEEFTAHFILQLRAHMHSMCTVMGKRL